MASFFWWGKLICTTIFSLFFLAFGIEALVGSFYLQSPIEFIMLFFSASLMILISVVGVIYPAFQVMPFFKTQKKDNDSK
ncbi:MAG: hypothetical protein L7F78_25830 [Syntrophales bacterium LBB04]|nr:hypothetical protein [Syntrophales bacterium LBB04]